MDFHVTFNWVILRWMLSVKCGLREALKIITNIYNNYKTSKIFLHFIYFSLLIPLSLAIKYIYLENSKQFSKFP